MTATFLSTKVLEKYNRDVDKLKVEMKRTNTDDRMWCLKSWEKDGKAIVKLYYGECNKLYGNSTGDHSKTTIVNMFANFSKKHLVSSPHVKINYCR
jgi:hypothetical protein